MICDYKCDLETLRSQAAEFYKQGGDFKKLVHCLFRMEDFVALENLIHELPDGHELLPEIGRIFTWVGLSTSAAEAHLKVFLLLTSYSLLNPI